MTDTESCFIDLILSTKILIDSSYVKFYDEDHVVFLFYKKSISVIWINLDIIKSKINITESTKETFKQLFSYNFNIRLNAVGYMKFETDIEIFETVVT